MLAIRIRCALFLLSAALAIGPAAGQHTDVFVDKDAPGTPDGTAWATAWLTVQDGIDDADGINGEVRILVAEGTYDPAEKWNGATDRHKTFVLKGSGDSSLVGLHGGFLGCKNGACTNIGNTDYDDPDGSFLRTILTGAAEDSYHVIVSDPDEQDGDAVVDGFRVTAGRADGSDPHDNGAGIYIKNSKDVLCEYITFDDNFAAEDGGAYWAHANTSTSNKFGLEECVVENNIAKRGAGIFVAATDKMLLCNIDIHENGASVAGGGGFPPITTRGGGIYADESVVLDCSNGLFDNNYAEKGGAVYINPIPCDDASNSYLHHYRNCTFADNDAPSSPGTNGSGIHVEARSMPDPTCADTTLHLDNCIFWTNANGDDVYLEAYNDVILDYCDWDTNQSGATSVSYTANSSISVDPEFLNAAGHNYRLDSVANSPCIDAGLNGSSGVGLDFLDIDDNGNSGETLPLDLDRTARVNNSTVDMGAYED